MREVLRLIQPNIAFPCINRGSMTVLWKVVRGAAENWSAKSFLTFDFCNG